MPILTKVFIRLTENTYFEQLNRITIYLLSFYEFSPPQFLRQLLILTKLLTCSPQNVLFHK